MADQLTLSQPGGTLSQPSSPKFLDLATALYLKRPCISYEKSMMREITNGTIEMDFFMFFFLSTFTLSHKNDDQFEFTQARN